MDSFTFQKIEANECYAVNAANFVTQVLQWVDEWHEPENGVWQALERQVVQQEVVEMVLQNYLLKIKCTPYCYESSALESYKALVLM